MIDVLVKEHGTEGAADQALVTADALVHIQPDDPALFVNGVRRTSIAALGNTALPADNGHADHRVRVKHHDPYPAFLGIIDFLPANAARQLTNAAARASLRDYGKMHRFLRLNETLIKTKDIYITERGGESQREEG
jgi:hypothetical protein